MGLFQRACETFDCMEKAGYVGKQREGHEILAPISHILTRAHIEITLNGEGQFSGAEAVDKKAPKIVIPVTEDSGGRTSKPCAHPLCDMLAYVSPYHEEKYTLYVQQLTDWSESQYTHPKLLPILTYVKSGTILSDLEQEGIIKLDTTGKPEKEKLMVCWRLIGMGEQNGPCWTDVSLFQSFIDYYNSKQNTSKELCMITGEVTTSAKQHPKGMIPINGNAKLISANDSNGFTYRGRFSEDWQAETISYAASQKAHNALRWIAAEQGVQVVFGGRTFLCWTPQGKKICHAVRPSAKAASKPVIKPSDYQDRLKHTLQNWQKGEQLTGEECAVIAAFDAATTGRLSLTYYNELPASDFMDRIRHWDAICCWWNGPFGLQTPPLWQIIDCAFGTQRTEKGQTKLKTDDRIMKQQMQRLVSCRIDRAEMPMDIERALVNRASTPQAYDVSVWKKIVFTACAVINCCKKGAAMSWELDKKDRSFQFGRLLAVMERAEADYYYKTKEERETNAIKQMSVFRQRPYHVYEQVNRQLRLAYLPRVEKVWRDRYMRLTEEIMAILRTFPEEELNKPLDDIYLMGYDCQRRAFFTKQEVNENERTTE